MSKSQLRKTYLTKRSQLSSHDREIASLTAAEIFVSLPSFKESKHIACYFAVNDEVNTTKIIEAIWQAKKQCYLPVLFSPKHAPTEKSLIFVRYQDGDMLHLNRYSIPEPVNQNYIISAENLDIVLTPLIAFDLKANRLGTGGGYYDRTFAFLCARKVSKPHLYGLAYAIQQSDVLPHDEWDISLNGVITEKGFISF